MPRRLPVRGGFPNVTRRTLPARGAKTIANASFAAVTQVEHTPQLEEEGLGADEKQAVELKKSEDTEPLVRAVREQKTIFTKFSSREDVQDGLCIVRKLGKGKYELIDLNSIIVEDLTTDSMRGKFASDPGRLRTFDLKDRDWKEAAFKCHQVMMNSTGRVFQFLKLPIEIRYLIYEICLVAKKSVRFGTKSTGHPNSAMNTSLLLSSRTIFDEGIKVWRKNIFFIDYVSLRRGSKLEFTDNIQVLEIKFDGSYKTDLQLFDILAGCQNLKVLKIEYGIRILSRFSRNRRQRTYQADPRVSSFRQLNGHDILCSLRGLESIEIVTVEANMHSTITNEDAKIYQGFLMELVTLPKPRGKLETGDFGPGKKSAQDSKTTTTSTLRKSHTWKRKPKYVGEDDEYDGSWD